MPFSFLEEKIIHNVILQFSNFNFNGKRLQIHFFLIASFRTCLLNKLDPQLWQWQYHPNNFTILIPPIAEVTRIRGKRIADPSLDIKRINHSSRANRVFQPSWPALLKWFIEIPWTVATAFGTIFRIAIAGRLFPYPTNGFRGLFRLPVVLRKIVAEHCDRYRVIASW